jgi:hypothetical protein
MHCIGWHEISKIHGKSLASSISKTKYGLAPHITTHKGWDFLWACLSTASSDLAIAMNYLHRMDSLYLRARTSYSLTYELAKGKHSSGNLITSNKHLPARPQYCGEQYAIFDFIKCNFMKI